MLRCLHVGERLESACSPSGSNSVGRVLASQARCRGFESRLPLHFPFAPALGTGRRPRAPGHPAQAGSERAPTLNLVVRGALTRAGQEGTPSSDSGTRSTSSAGRPERRRAAWRCSRFPGGCWEAAAVPPCCPASRLRQRSEHVRRSRRSRNGMTRRQTTHRGMARGSRWRFMATSRRARRRQPSGGRPSGSRLHSQQTDAVAAPTVPPGCDQARAGHRGPHRHLTS